MYNKQVWVVAGVTAAASVSAMEPSDVLLFSKGSLSLRPQLNASQVYNDNIYFQEEGATADLISVVSPGFVLLYGDQDYNFLRLNYFYDRVQFWDENDLSANQHRLDFSTKLQRNRYTLTGKDQIELLSTVLGGGINLVGQKVDRTTFFDEYRLTIEATDKTSVYFEGTHDATDFQDDLFLYDSRTLIGTGGFEFKAFERISLFGEVFGGQTTLEENFATMLEVPTASFVGAFVGARGAFMEKLTGSIKAGYELRWFEETDGTSGLPIVQANVTYQITDNSNIVGSFTRRQRVSVQFAQTEYAANLLSLDYNQSYGSTGRLRSRVSASYGMMDYEIQSLKPGAPAPLFNERSDSLILAGFDLTYDFKIWLRGILSYDYERLRSDLAAIEDYDVNRVTLGIAIGY